MVFFHGAAPCHGWVAGDIDSLARLQKSDIGFCFFLATSRLTSLAVVGYKKEFDAALDVRRVSFIEPTAACGGDPQDAHAAMLYSMRSHDHASELHLRKSARWSLVLLIRACVPARGPGGPCPGALRVAIWPRGRAVSTVFRQGRRTAAKERSSRRAGPLRQAAG